MLPIIVSSIHKTLHLPHLVSGQKEQGENDIHRPEMQQPPEGVHHYQQKLEQMQQWEEFALSMMT